MQLEFEKNNPDCLLEVVHIIPKIIHLLQYVSNCALRIVCY